MLKRWAKVLLLSGVCSGLCLHAQANTTVPASAVAAPVAPASASAAPALVRTVQNDVALPPDGAFPAPSVTHIALLLPLRSDTLADAAKVLRAGFMAAYEHEQDGIEVGVVETGDAPQEVLAGYAAASTQYDIVVGPLSRTGVTAVAQGNAVTKPTIALTPPDSQDGAEVVLPPQLLVMGLSIEDEARQAAKWAGADRKSSKAYVVHSSTAWQRRAAKAFEAQWQQLGLADEMVEVAANDGFLNGRTLLQLKKQIQDEKSVLLFAALDARQARQVRAILGSGIPMYGTSQLNPYAFSDWNDADRSMEMNGAHLLDIPWQLQPDHPAVMVYPRLVVEAAQKRSADLERLYALGIDAYRVAREIAAKNTDFRLDGVTGRLKVHFDQNRVQFERTAQQAIYRDGGVVSDSNAQ